MKKILLSVAAVMPLAFSVHAVTNMCVEQKDGTIVRYDVENVKQVYYEEAGVTVSGKIGDYTYVDLGLRSGLKWATFNVGATKPEEYGDYLAWGEKEPKERYDFSTYILCGGDYDKMNKYCTKSKFGTVDNRTVLMSEDDAATLNWGVDWRMPTDKELNELIEGCTWVWVEDYEGTGVSGGYGTSKKNGNTIFLPAAGWIIESYPYSDYEGKECLYWSSSLYNDYQDHAHIFVMLSNGYMKVEQTPRNRGLSVRAVAK